MEKLEDFDGPDISFAEYLDREQTPVEERGRIIGYVEGFNAADHREVSAASLGAQQKAEDADGSDHNYRLRGGYDQLPRYLSERITEFGGKVLTGTPVKEIRWEQGRVEVVSDLWSFRAPHAIVTLPLAVLQRGKCEDYAAPAPDSGGGEAAADGTGPAFHVVVCGEVLGGPAAATGVERDEFSFRVSEMPPVWWTRIRRRATRSRAGWAGLVRRR